MRPATETRPQNNTANHTILATLPALSNVGSRASRVDGNFTGTTDEVIQWAACKWGLDEDMQRARAVQESWWKQDTLGDGGDSMCIFQVRRPYFPATSARTSTAYCADVDGAYQRACYDGEFTWLNDFAPPRPYVAGDAIGCAGTWYQGRWYAPASAAYIGSASQQYSVLGHLANKPWLHMPWPN